MYVLNILEVTLGMQVPLPTAHYPHHLPDEMNRDPSTSSPMPSRHSPRTPPPVSQPHLVSCEVDHCKGVIGLRAGVAA
jgi:hypothetical protein